MEVKVYDSTGKALFTLRRASISHLESNAYRITGSCEEPVVDLAPLFDLTLEVVDGGKVTATYTQGLATKATCGKHGSLVRIDAVLPVPTRKA